MAGVYQNVPISQITLRLERFFNHHEDPSLSSLFYLLDQFIMSLDISGRSRKENSQKLTQLSSRSHPRHLMGKKTAQKDTITLRLGQFFNNHRDPLLSSLFYLFDQFINQPWYKWQESIRMYLSVRSHSDWGGFLIIMKDPLLSSLFYLLDQFMYQPWHKWQESIRMYLSVRSHSDWDGFLLIMKTHYFPRCFTC